MNAVLGRADAPVADPVQLALQRYLHLGRLRVYAQVLANEFEFEFNHSGVSSSRHAVAVANLREALDAWAPQSRDEVRPEEWAAVQYARRCFEGAGSALRRATEVRPSKSQTRSNTYVKRAETTSVVNTAGNDENPVVGAVYAATRQVRDGADVLAGWQRFRRRDTAFAAVGDTAAHANVRIPERVRDDLWQQLRDGVDEYDSLLRQFTPAARHDPDAVSELCRGNRDLFFRWFYTLTLCPAWWTVRAQAEVTTLLERTVGMMPHGQYWEASARRYHTLLVYFPAPFGEPVVYFRHASDPDYARERETV